MKHWYLGILSTTVLLLLATCTGKRGSVTPEGLGKYVFGILKSLDSTSEEAFLNHFIPLSDIKAMSEDEERVKNPTTRSMMRNMRQEEWNMLILEEHALLVDRGEASGIVWQDVEYAKFDYEILDKEGIRGVEGALYFGHRNETFSVEMKAIWDGSAYRLTVLQNLDQIGTWPGNSPK